MSTTDPLWYAWNGITATTSTAASTIYVPYDNGWRMWWTGTGGTAIPPVGTVIAQQGAALEYPRLLRDREAARSAAAARAERLLLKCLNEEERHCYLTHHFFDVLGSDGFIYRIQQGMHGNVRQMEAGPDGTLRSVAKLCCQPEGVPIADVHLAQALWLKHDAARFRRVANITALPGIGSLVPAPVTERQFFNGRLPALVRA